MSVPSSAVLVRSENPCARYRTTAMITADPHSASVTASSPAIRPGSTYCHRTTKARPRPTIARSPRQPATRAVMMTNASARVASGTPRAKSDHAHASGAPSAAG